MRVALVHELLTMKGGAEKVLRILAGMFPEAPIYTLLYDEKKLGEWFPKERVVPSQIQRQFPLRFCKASPFFNHHLYLRRFPAAVEAWDFSGFDLVISSSSAFAHGIITNGTPKHLCYVHSPARYLWDRTHDVLAQAGKGFAGPLRASYLSRTFQPLRVWDAESADRPDKLIAASKAIQRRIELYWRRESEVITPPLDDFWLKGTMPEKTEKAPYFFIASTLAPYKRIDVAIEACNSVRIPLKIAGEGRDLKRLRSLAGPTIEFLGFQNESQLRALYVHAKATIFPGDEDFGLVPLEALSNGTPVIAYRCGGALETLRDGTDALFFDEPTASSLSAVLSSFDAHTFQRSSLRKQAETFSRSRFERQINAAIAAL